MVSLLESQVGDLGPRCARAQLRRKSGRIGGDPFRHGAIPLGRIAGFAGADEIFRHRQTAVPHRCLMIERGSGGAAIHAGRVPDAIHVGNRFGFPVSRRRSPYQMKAIALMERVAARTCSLGGPVQDAIVSADAPHLARCVVALNKTRRFALDPAVPGARYRREGCRLATATRAESRLEPMLLGDVRALRRALFADLPGSVPMDEADRLPLNPACAGNRLCRKGRRLAAAALTQPGVERSRCPRLKGMLTIVSGEIAQRLTLELAAIRARLCRKGCGLPAATAAQSRVVNHVEIVSRCRRRVVAAKQPAFVLPFETVRRWSATR